MRRRLYFLLPDLGSAIKTANDLLLARVEDSHMHFLAKRGMSLGPLHEANYLQKSDCVHGAELGFVLGGAGGFLIGIYIYLTPPDGVTLQLVTVLISTVIGAVFGASASSRRCRRFRSDSLISTRQVRPTGRAGIARGRRSTPRARWPAPSRESRESVAATGCGSRPGPAARRNSPPHVRRAQRAAARAAHRASRAWPRRSKPWRSPLCTARALFRRWRGRKHGSASIAAPARGVSRTAPSI